MTLYFIIISVNPNTEGHPADDSIYSLKRQLGAGTKITGYFVILIYNI